MFKIIFGIIIGYIACDMNAGSAMKEGFVNSGAKEIVIEKIEEIK
tara:strand:+ start:412 stop:546 length:135 start_codon:yes stop_codon:yes gene_type:complete